MRNKSKLTGLKSHYIKLPNELLQMSLDMADIVLMLYLVYLPEDFNPSVRLLAKKLGCSINTVRKALTNLETKGMIKKYEVGNFKLGKTAKYEFRPRNEWKKL